MKTKCKHYKGKVGGIFYGFKCGLHHNGNFTVYSNGERIQYFYGRGEGGAEHNKEGRDKYVADKCLSDCTSCTLYR